MNIGANGQAIKDGAGAWCIRPGLKKSSGGGPGAALSAKNPAQAQHVARTRFDARDGMFRPIRPEQLDPPVSSILS
jgi:hypothetical protein